jgi:hypothetical protein
MKTPSKLLDQDPDNKVEDKYWGRMPMYLHKNPEAGIYECNPEYVSLFGSFFEGTIDEQNMSIEMYNEIMDVWNAAPEYGKFPMPLLDPFFQCAGLMPQVPTTPVFITVDQQYNGAVFWTADREPLGVQPE